MPDPTTQELLAESLALVASAPPVVRDRKRHKRQLRITLVGRAIRKGTAK